MIGDPMIDLCGKHERTASGSSRKHPTVENGTVLAKAHGNTNKDISAMR
jgi:hypothetical protein